MASGSKANAAQLREIGGLALSCVQVEEPMLMVRAAHWRNALARVGLPVPFWVVHDLGALATPEAASLPIAPRQSARSLPLPPDAKGHLARWTETLEEISQSEMMEKSRQWRLSDELISVLLLKILGPIYERHLGPGRRPIGVPLPLDPDAYKDIDTRLAELFTGADRTADMSFLRHLAAEQVRLITAIEQVDLDTLRLLGMFGAEASAANALGMLDLLNVFESPEANDVVNFSLELLPSVLETKRATGQQSFSVDGYSGIARRGTLDSLMLSELAFDEDLFDQRYMENELFYYARERQHEEDRRLHYIVIDATASMRGQRSVFARGLALTLIKKLGLRGEEVYARFFDSRLYEVQHARSRHRASEAGINVPYILAFKGEHGRNYAKVFGLLANDITRLAQRERRTPILYILTHAECHVPLDTIERLRSVARLYGVFMLPSQGALDLEYLSRLHTVQVVDEAALKERDVRAKRAMDIIDDATTEDEKQKAKKDDEPDFEAEAMEELDAYLGHRPTRS